MPFGDFEPVAPGRASDVRETGAPQSARIPLERRGSASASTLDVLRKADVLNDFPTFGRAVQPSPNQFAISGSSLVDSRPRLVFATRA